MEAGEGLRLSCASSRIGENLGEQGEEPTCAEAFTVS